MNVNTKEEREVVIAEIKSTYKPKVGHKIIMSGSGSNLLAFVFKDVPIKTRYGTDIAETSLCNISTGDKEGFIKFLEQYMDLREIV